MASKRNTPIHYPASEKIYMSGEINKVRVGMRRIKLSDTVLIEDNGVKSTKKNNPVVLYDTSGPYSDPKLSAEANAGLSRIREEWCNRRKDIVRLENFSDDFKSPNESSSPIYIPYRAKEGKIISQMHYAKRRIITPEMEYVAIRENQQVEALGLKSYITPDFVRKEIAAGRAVIPANVNHPEAEPMIIGKKFLVKINANMDSSSSDAAKGDFSERIIWNCKWGSDTLLDVSASGNIRNVQNVLLRNSPVPVGSIPLYKALAAVQGNIEMLDWDTYRNTLIEQAELGIDFFIIHAALLKKDIDKISSRLTGITTNAAGIMVQWMHIHKKENFLYTHFSDICEILKAYDITLVIGDSFCSGSVYDANDMAFFSELQTKGELTRLAWEHMIQVMTEGAGHIPLNKINENIKEQQYACLHAPYFSFGPVSTDIAFGNDHIASSIGAAQIAWQGASLLGCAFPRRNLLSLTKEEIRNTIVAFKIAAHSADLAKGHPGAQARDNAISKAFVEGRIKDVCNLAIDPEKASRSYK